MMIFVIQCVNGKTTTPRNLRKHTALLHKAVYSSSSGW